ncbi:uncharacterized protein METZ01_LOCUS111224 [marine metagenome]|uniref:Uncharacterized protein n=1 Tax=marine metagenome TaxID=408172 RepID=A0A381X0Z7_9ZZZZ
MPDKFNNNDFENHIKTLIINKEIYKMLEQLRSIMRKIVFILGDENWGNNNFSDYQKTQSLEFIIDYSFIYCVNELTVVLNDSGTLAPMAGVKKWKEQYDSMFLEYFLKTKEIKSNKNNIKSIDNNKLIKSLHKLWTCKNEDDIEKEILKIGGKYNIERNDLISMRGFTFKLEDRILNAIWDEE